MATYTKTILSGSTDGKAVDVAATSSPGTTIHTGSSTAADLHEVWLWAVNTDTTAHTVTIQWGGTATADGVSVYLLAAGDGPVPVAPGLLIKGNATPLVVKAYADAANKVSLHGFVNEIA